MLLSQVLNEMLPRTVPGDPVYQGNNPNPRSGVAARAEGRSCPFFFRYNDLSHHGYLLVSNDL